MGPSRGRVVTRDSAPPAKQAPCPERATDLPGSPEAALREGSGEGAVPPAPQRLLRYEAGAQSGKTGSSDLTTEDFWSAKGTVGRMKSAVNWRKILAERTSDKDLASRVDKELRARC